MTLTVGTAEAEPGERANGWLTVTDLPTGGAERLPVVLVNGDRDGPTLWVTAGVHGDEVTATAAAQDVAHERLPDVLAGALVVLPTLNPAGLRRTARTSYYHDDDPNRYFPDRDADAYRPPRVQERIDTRVFEALTGSADAHLDLHTAAPNSMPFVIRDRVLHGDRRDEDAAESLADDLDALATALGLPVVNEYPAEEYVGESLQRSAAGAALNEAGIPALTLELGGPDVVDEDARALGVAACYRAMVDRGLLDAVPAFGPDVAPLSAPVDYPVRRYVGPHTDRAGIVRHRVAAGDTVDSGDVVATVRTPHGEHVSRVETDTDGFVLGRMRGVAAYEGDPVASLAVRDTGDLVVPRDP